MSPEEKEIRLLQLISAACDEQLDSHSQRELEFFLLEDEAARRLYANYTQMHCDLRLQIGEGQALQRAMENMPERRRSSRRTRVLLALAASVVLLVGWFAYSSRPREDFSEFPLFASRDSVPVSTVSNVDGATWGGTSFKKNDVLLTGQQLRLKQGTATISMGVGADVMLHAPCGIDLISANHILLNSGEVTVQVADWAKGFRVETSAIDIVDLGTRFHVSAIASGAVKVSVLEGKIQVKPRQADLSGRQSLVLTTGEGVQVNRTGNEVKRFEHQDSESFVEFPDIAPYKPIRIHSTGRGFNRGDEDPHWRIIAGKVSGDYLGPQFAVVCHPVGTYLSDRADVSQWIAVTENVSRGSAPDSIYTFETQFDLSGYDLTSVTVSGQLLADNGIEAIRINGEPVVLTPWVDDAAGQIFDRFREVRITDGFRSGNNTIEVDVFNAPPGINPMALRAEWTGFGRVVE